MLRHGSGAAARLTESRLRADAAAAAAQLDQLLPATGERHGAWHQYEQHEQWQHCQRCGWCVQFSAVWRRWRLPASPTHVSSTAQSARANQVSRCEVTHHLLASYMYSFAFRGLDPQRGYTSDPLSPDQPGGGYVVNGQQGISVAQSQRGGTTTATPTMQQRIKPLGVATPLVSASPVRR